MERESEKHRGERNISRLPPVCAPTGNEPPAEVCALTGNGTHDPMVYSMTFQPPEPHWPRLGISFSRHLSVYKHLLCPAPPAPGDTQQKTQQGLRPELTQAEGRHGCQV